MQTKFWSHQYGIKVIFYSIDRTQFFITCFKNFTRVFPNVLFTETTKNLAI